MMHVPINTKKPFSFYWKCCPFSDIGTARQDIYNNELRCLHFACRTTKATNRHSEYIILFAFHCHTSYTNGHQYYVASTSLTTHSILVPRSWKSRAIPLPTLWATFCALFYILIRRHPNKHPVFFKNNYSGSCWSATLGVSPSPQFICLSCYRRVLVIGENASNVRHVRLPVRQHVSERLSIDLQAE